MLSTPWRTLQLLGAVVAVALVQREGGAKSEWVDTAVSQDRAGLRWYERISP